MFATLAILASTIALQASDGTRINVNYGLQRQDQVGDSVESWIASLAVDVQPVGRDATAVIIGRCAGTGSFTHDYSVSCRSFGQSHIPLTDECHVDATAADVPRFVRSTLPELRFHGRFREGRSEDCSYELAVVRDGVWLVDPVNGSHNFQLSIPRPQL
jgi:hypothetical protein